uniref:Reverse transcriptase zinc-binding domain-containing protein n=1 Tax=Oryza punctata TaxID=4537 RepID=A0A0E0M1R3_ORYPU
MLWTMDRLERRGWQNQKVCSLCCMVDESAVHPLAKCRVTKRVWAEIRRWTSTDLQMDKWNDCHSVEHRRNLVLESPSSPRQTAQNSGDSGILGSMFPLWVSFFSITLATIFFLRTLLRHKHNRRAYSLPPGPKPWPIIGNLNLLGSLPHRSIHSLSKRYGPLMYLRFGSFPVVVGSSVEMAKFFLKTHDVVFADRPKTAAGKYTTYNYSDMTWSPYGAYWRQARKMCLTELFSCKRIESYEFIRSEEVTALLRDLHAASGRVVTLKDYLSTASLNVISRMMLGKKYLEREVVGHRGELVTTPEQFRWMLDELFLLNGVLDIGDSIPWLGWLDLQGYIRRMKKLSKMFDQFLEYVLDEHENRMRREGEKFVAKDLVDVLLNVASDPSLEVKFNRDSVKAFTQDLIAGGTESASVTVEWAIAELLRKPEVFAKATEELDRVVGRGRWVTEEDIPSLPYIDAIMKETMRMHPVAPMLAPRLSREDTSVDGYDIPAGTRVLVSVWSIGRDPKLWDAPEEFMPERFVGSKIDVKGQDFELLPFGSGRRMCPGYSLGLKVIQVSLANLLHGFAWRLPDGMTKEQLSMEEIFGLSTPRKFPLDVVVESKLPAHLYASACML